MRVRLSELRRIIREALKSPCRACGGAGEVAGEFCAACGGEGEELDYGATRSGIGRGPLPWRK